MKHRARVLSQAVPFFPFGLPKVCKVAVVDFYKASVGQGFCSLVGFSLGFIYVPAKVTVEFNEVFCFNEVFRLVKSSVSTKSSVLMKSSGKEVLCQKEVVCLKESSIKGALR